MPKLDLDDGRFLRIGDRRSPGLLIDPAAIAAIELNGQLADGGCSVHLAGGQTLQLDAAAGAALAKKLGAVRIENREARIDKPKPAKPKPRRRARSSDASPAEAPPPAVPFGQQLRGYLARLLD